MTSREICFIMNWLIYDAVLRVYKQRAEQQSGQVWSGLITAQNQTQLYIDYTRWDETFTFRSDVLHLVVGAHLSQY